VPDDATAVAFYDALCIFVDFNGFSELKRTARAPLVEVPARHSRPGAGVAVEQYPGPVVAKAGPTGLGAQILDRRTTGRSGSALGEEDGPAARPRRRRGSRWAVPEAQYTYSVAPPLLTMAARRASRSRSATSRARMSEARAAVS